MTAPFGVYVHVPFCAHRCDYCAFATWTDRAHLVDAYLAAVRTEISRAVDAGMPPADTVFVGGGTPTLVPAEGLASVLRAIPLARGAEVTVECNPDDVTEAKFETYLAAGVTRVSIGVQSMVPHVLAALGRTHDPANVETAVSAARAVGVETFNLDIIYGAVGERLADWRTTLERTIDLGPPHVSAYALTVEAGTPLAGDPARHPDDDVQADEYELADELLDERRAGQLRGLQLVPAGSRVPAQPPVLGPARLPRLRLRRPFAPRRTSLVEPADAGALHRRRGRWPVDGGRRRDPRRRDPPHRRVAAGAAHDRRRARRRPRR